MTTPLSVTVTPASLTLSRAGTRIEGGETTFTVTNTGARGVIVRAALEPLGGTERAWLSLQGEAQRDFAPNATHAFTVRVAPPPDAPAGRHAFRLNVVDVHHPDEGEVEGPEVAFEVPPAPADDGPTVPRWLWMLIAAVVLLGGAAALAVVFWPFGSVNEAPSLADVENVRTLQGEAVEVPLVIRDEEAGTVTIEARSSDETLVAADDAEVTGEGADRLLRVTPARFGVGRVVLTLVARDAEGLEGRTSFELEVRRPFDVQLPALTAGDGSEGSFFGTSVALDGDYAVVGASFDGGVAEAAGAAYLYRLGGGVWTETTKLTASDADELDRFGMSVALDGDHALIAARFDQEAAEDAGAAYVFQRQGEAWREVAKLTARDAEEDTLFGFDVALDAGRALIGALTHEAGEDAGSAYLFEREGDDWRQVQKLTASDAAAGDRFGSVVALDGDTALIGAPSHDGAAEDAGAAYVFQRQGDAFGEVARLTARDGREDASFGDAVALDGDTAIIGAPGDTHDGDGKGAAYVFQRQGDAWREVVKLTARDARAEHLFGGDVALDGDYALVNGGAFLLEDPDFSVYVYRRDDDTWRMLRRLTAREVGANGFFGTSIALDGPRLLLSAPFDDMGGDEAVGAVYAFQD